MCGSHRDGDEQSNSILQVARYGLSLFLILYLLGEMLRLSADGKELLVDPLPVLTTKNKTNPRQKAVLQGVASLVKFLVTELNYYIKEHEGEAYDYKSEFKIAEID